MTEKINIYQNENNFSSVMIMNESGTCNRRAFIPWMGSAWCHRPQMRAHYYCLRISSQHTRKGRIRVKVDSSSSSPLAHAVRTGVPTGRGRSSREYGARGRAAQTCASIPWRLRQFGPGRCDVYSIQCTLSMRFLKESFISSEFARTRYHSSLSLWGNF